MDLPVFPATADILETDFYEELLYYYENDIGSTTSTNKRKKEGNRK
jgi:hypothetical protein